MGTSRPLPVTPAYVPACTGVAHSQSDCDLSSVQSPQKEISLDVVIVNWNSGEHLRRCVSSIGRAVGHATGLRLIVVDNDSTDDSLDALDAAALPLTVLRNDENLGFAAGCNRGAQVGRAETILFLNPDTIIPGVDSLTAPLAALRAQRDVGVVGVQLRAIDGSVTRSCTRFPTARRASAWSLGVDRLFPRLVPPQFLREFDHEQDADVDIVLGAFFMTTRETFERLGGFDERYFLYYEEVDFARRIRASGKRILFLADAHVTHIGHGSSYQVVARRHFYVTRSRILYGFRHFSTTGAIATTIATLIGEPIARTIGHLAQGDASGALAMLHGTALLWGDVPRLLLADEAPEPQWEPDPELRAVAAD
jgi:N-acetylglucosaminyl-diphospho-decaprenol L-rhamnosyltransferase